MTSYNPDSRLTTAEAARILGCGLQSVVRACNDGSLPHYRLPFRGKHRRIVYADLLEWMERNGIPAPRGNGG